jgi:hypothetical protein
MQELEGYPVACSHLLAAALDKSLALALRQVNHMVQVVLERLVLGEKNLPSNYYSSIISPSVSL